ncbi:serine/threonine protein kinase [Aestuariirhabdus sp. Z084]|uniref:serine/threonine-protein kinase n=1 Tax=Aestuariirhabdus haliotis TaxID=2918751 RepID=UPI00201B426E|nr:serine/threonine-protein kinase [Aestuariirhabdus haliotis]MCL6415537.1 serine/threonine protein kinase [Aestuariirhabdus haliotis]MCL6419258.1 serine/threonine protein kinase [Aestuariirhabdus haliotis]
MKWLLALFSARFLVILLTGLLLGEWLTLNAANQRWLSWSALFHPQAEDSSLPTPIQVLLPYGEQRKVQGHPVLSTPLYNLLRQQIKQGGKAVLQLPSSPLLSTSALSQLGTDKKLQSKLQQLRVWQKSGQLMLAVDPTRPPYPTAYKEQKATVEASSALPRFISQSLNRQPPELQSPTITDSQILWPTASANDYGLPLIFQLEERWYAGLLLQLARQYSSTTIHWLANDGLVGENGQRYSGSDGYLYPLPNTQNTPLQYSLKDASKQTSPRVLLVIDASQSSHQPGLASAITALQQSQYLHSTPWNGGIRWALMLSIALYLLIIMPLFGVLRGSLSSLLIGLALITSQLVLQRLYGYWIPVAEPLLLLFLGSALMMIQLRQQQGYQQLQRRYQDKSIQLGSTLYHQGKLNEAASAINGCGTSDELLALTYDIAQQQEQTQDLQGALQNYTQIKQRRRQFKDVGERIDKLSGKLGDTVADISLAATQTMMLPEQSGSTPHLGRYEVIREIGRGAMGVVYLGRDPRIARTVAIKTLTYDQFESSRIKEMKSRFFREAEAAGRLNHPNIVTVFDMGEEQSLAFIAMDFAKGSPLNRHCKPGTLLPVSTVYRIVEEVASALSYAHQQKIVHRDIKPGNIMFDADSGEVKVTDFGIARISDDSQTKTGSILGSPLYMSPEQLKGSKVTGTADIYSLGVTFYQLLTGELPFHGDSLANLTYQIINGKYKSVRTHRSELPASATRIVNKALQKDASKRYQDASEMAEALRKSINKEFAREPA